MESLSIFKVSGKLLDSEREWQEFLEGFAALQGKKILIHGGGVRADEIAQGLGLPVTMHEGRRITSPAMRDVTTMVYAGLINKQIVARLQSLSCDAIGLSGADARILRAKRRAAHPIDFGCVGDIRSVRSDFLDRLLMQGFVPVIAPLSWEAETGELLNSNADGVACHVTEAFSGIYQTRLLYCSDKPGVLLDLRDQASLLKGLDRARYEQLKRAQIVRDGMLPKLDSCFRAKTLGAHEVLIASPQNSLRFAQGQHYQGTLIA